MTIGVWAESATVEAGALLLAAVTGVFGPATEDIANGGVDGVAA